MILTTISVLVCLGLVIKLAFFSGSHRRESRWFYRVVLFLTVLYAGRHVINIAYDPDYQLSAWQVFLHLSLFTGAFFLKPHHLPWNQK